MFVRFRNAGLSWPLPAGMSEQDLMPAFTDNSPRYQPYVLKAQLCPKPPW